MVAWRHQSDVWRCFSGLKRNQRMRATILLMKSKNSCTLYLSVSHYFTFSILLLPFPLLFSFMLLLTILIYLFLFLLPFCCLLTPSLWYMFRCFLWHFLNCFNFFNIILHGLIVCYVTLSYCFLVMYWKSLVKFNLSVMGKLQNKDCKIRNGS